MLSEILQRKGIAAVQQPMQCCCVLRLEGDAIAEPALQCLIHTHCYTEKACDNELKLKQNLQDLGRYSAATHKLISQRLC